MSTTIQTKILQQSVRLRHDVHMYVCTLIQTYRERPIGIMRLQLQNLETAF